MSGFGVIVMMVSLQSSQLISTRDVSFSEHREWFQIWHINLSNRIRTALWLIQHDKLKSNAERRKWGFASNDECGVCREGVEDLGRLHLLRTCTDAAQIWRVVLPSPEKLNCK